MKRIARVTPSLWMTISASLLLSQSVCAQSLGDIARQQREKNKQQAATINKELTNEDISTSGDATGSSPETSQKKTAKPKPSANVPLRQNNQAPSAEEFQAAIQQKKQAIAEIQDRIGKLQSTINYVQNNRNIYTNAPEYNEAQKRKEQEVNQLKGILQGQQDELQELQKQAKDAGYGSAVYD